MNGADFPERSCVCAPLQYLSQRAASFPTGAAPQSRTIAMGLREWVQARKWSVAESRPAHSLRSRSLSATREDRRQALGQSARLATRAARRCGPLPMDSEAKAVRTRRQTTGHQSLAVFDAP